jgi:hypothetical protein
MGEILAGHGLTEIPLAIPIITWPFTCLIFEIILVKHFIGDRPRLDLAVV